MKRKSVSLEIELVKRQRGNWHGVNPVTRVVPSGKTYRRKDRYNRKSGRS